MVSWWLNERVSEENFISDQFRQAYEFSMLSFYPLRFRIASQPVKTRAIHNEAIPDDSNTLSTGIELFLVVNKNVVACYLTKFRVSRNE